MNNPRSGISQAGIGLIEILVALVLLSFAVLGTSEMLLRAERASIDAHYRVVATDIAMNLSERIRSNLPALDDGDDDPDDGGSYRLDTDCDTPPTIQCGVSPAIDSTKVGDCSHQEMAQFDLWQLRCVNGINHLPNGELTVNCLADSSAGVSRPCGMRQIEVRWQAVGEESQSLISMPFLPGPASGL